MDAATCYLSPRWGRPHKQKNNIFFLLYIIEIIYFFYLTIVANSGLLLLSAFFLNYSIFQQSSSKCLSSPSVLRATCSLLLLFPVPSSLTPLLQVIIAAFEEERVPSLFPFHSLNAAPPHPVPNTGFLLKKFHVAVRLRTTNNPHPPPALLRRAQLSGECRCLEASCIKLPHSGQRHRGTVGARLFWHSLYVLLIGANWHRGAPLFRCIIWPHSTRWEERA